MKKRTLPLIFCVLLLFSFAAFFAIPAAAEEFSVSLVDGKLYWHAYPGADLYSLCLKFLYNGQGNSVEYRLSDAPVDLSEAMKRMPAGEYEVSLSALKGRSARDELLAKSEVFPYYNDTDIPSLPAPELKWEGTVLKITPFDLTPYQEYGLTVDNFQANVRVYENGTLLDNSNMLAYKFQIDRLDAFMDYPDRRIMVKVSLFGNSSNVLVGHSPTVMSEEVLARDLLNGYVTRDRINGEVSIAPEEYACTPGHALVASCTSMNASEDALMYTWHSASSPDSADWKHVASDRTGRLFLTDDLIGKYVRCLITADDHSGYLKSNALYVFKRAQSAAPVPPELEQSGGRIVITNAKTTQEYYVSAERLTVIALEELWKNARSPSSDGSFTLSGTSDTLNYVYTRWKETAGYKEYSGLSLIEIMDRTVDGETVYTDDVPEAYLGKLAVSTLSDRQKDVLRCLIAGLTNKEIAEALYLSPHTVKTYVNDIMESSGLHSRTELAVRASKLGLSVNKS